MRPGRRAAACARRFPALALASLLAAACTGPLTRDTRREWKETRHLHGVEVHLAVRGGSRAAARLAMGDAFAAAEEVGGLLLASRPGSEIDVLCHVPSHLWLEISPVTHAALVLAGRISSETDGAYDPTWPPLLRVWGLRGPGPPRVPRDFEIEMALRRVDFTDVELDDSDGLQARRLSHRTEIDLGGLARGAMLDAAVERLQELGVAAGRADTTFEHALFGGTEREPWRVAIRLRGEAGAPAPEPGVVALRDGALAVASRGPAIATADGTSIFDRFDPRSGRPARAHWTLVAAPFASESAGYAEALLAIGEEGRAFVESRADLRAAIASESDTWWSPALALELAPPR